MTEELYIWFEADPDMDDAVRAGFKALRRRLAGDAANTLVGAPRLLRRADLRQRPAGLRATWMEIWRLKAEVDPAVFSAGLEREAVLVGLTHLAQGGRQTEIFRVQDDAPRPPADR